MQKHLRALKPDKFADLIAMNALYRPGPLEYIPTLLHENTVGKKFLRPRGYGRLFGETYGITVYQDR